MQSIGVDSRAIPIMLEKASPLSIKAKNLTRIQCNILKQQLLSTGADAAVSREILSEEVETSDALIIGSVKQIAGALKSARQPHFDMERLVDEIEDVLGRYNASRLVWNVGKRTYEMDGNVLVMAILNVTPDSFYDGGRYGTLEKALAHARKMIDEGADMLDVGGQSSRPGAQEIPLEEELNRTIPLIEKIAGESDIPISIDTYREAVARQALEKGAGIINDITALRGDERMAALAAESGCGLVLMHMQGTPRTMQKNPHYDDLMSEIIALLRESVGRAVEAGLNEQNIAVDPGIGFGKTVEHNYRIISQLKSLKSIGRPILIGPSRKSFIGKVLKNEAQDRLLGTAASITCCIERGASIIRVHDVKEMIEVKEITGAILSNRNLTERPD